jgi:hypothetical protein
MFVVWRDYGAASALADDEPLIGQLAECLAHDAAGDLVFVLKLLFGGERSARWNGLTDDLSLQLVPQLGVKRPTGAFEHDHIPPNFCGRSCPAAYRCFCSQK